jgi:hypothetical protein
MSKTLILFITLIFSDTFINSSNILDQVFQTEFELVIPPQNLLEGLHLNHKLEKIQVKINHSFWNSIQKQISDFNTGKWSSFGISVRPELTNCSKMNFNFDPK